jgi:adenylate cyclase
VNELSRFGSFRERVLARLAQIGVDPHDDEDTRASKALLVLISVLILPVALLWATLYLAFGSPVGWVPLGYAAVLLAAIVVFSRTRNFGQLLLVGQVAILLAPTLSMIPLGGFLASGGVGLWGILAPLGALVFSDARSAARWYVAYVVVFLGSGIAGELSGGVSPTVPEWFTSTMLALNVTVGGTIVFTLLALFADQRRNALAALRVEQAKAESLLLNILPRSIADKLKAEPQTIADQFSSASILFADVVDFTPLSERLPPDEVVGLLDRLFSHFDVLAERYGLEKIKTIGDCYMVAAGVPSPRADHARALALMALDMVASMRSVEEVGHLGLELRVGINSGPVVAGVIGRKRFLYDLWGDAVNTASRMESQGTSGRIQITRATKELLEDEFVCEPRGTIPVKGKGEMEAWYLVGRRADATAEPGAHPEPVRPPQVVPKGAE